MQKSYFNYFYKNGWIDINTLSPNDIFFYKIQNPEELNKSAYGVRVAFYTIDNILIYHRNKFYAHELHTKEEVENMRDAMEQGKYYLIKPSLTKEFIKWSIEGNMAFMFEYYSWNHVKIFESVFINLKEKYCYRVNELENDSEIISQIRPIDQNYSEKQVILTMDSLGYAKEPLIVEEISSFRIFGKKWYPEKNNFP
jgi:hypothetical protein